MDANNIFFNNGMIALKRISDLMEFREYLDIYIKDNERYIREEGHVDLELEFLPLFASTFPSILHSSLVISTVMIIEVDLRGFADALQEYLHLPLSITDLQGSTLERFRKYALDLASLDIHLPSIWPDVIGLFEIRNCLIHQYGSLERFGRRTVIEDFARRYNIPRIENNVIQIDEDTSAKAIEIGSNFLDAIYDAALRRFPGQYTWHL